MNRQRMNLLRGFVTVGLLGVAHTGGFLRDALAAGQTPTSGVVTADDATLQTQIADGRRRRSSGR